MIPERRETNKTSHKITQILLGGDFWTTVRRGKIQRDLKSTV